MKRGFIERSPMPMVRSDRGEPSLPRTILSAAEVEAILAAIDVTRPAGLRDRAMFEVLYSTGLRRGELAALKLDGIDVARGIILLRTGKGGKDRFVPIGERALDWVMRYVEEVRAKHVPHPDPKHVFVSRQKRPLCAAMIGTRLAEAVRAAGIDKKVTPHALRHTAATLLLEGGADTRDIPSVPRAQGHNDDGDLHPGHHRAPQASA